MLYASHGTLGCIFNHFATRIAWDIFIDHFEDVSWEEFNKMVFDQYRFAQ